jgi:mannose-6-phosphate isomerase-like protein (cupin superfamily)
VGEPADADPPISRDLRCRSPAGAEIRYLLEGAAGNMTHSTVASGQVNRATVHATVSELWHVLSGQGEIWRRDERGEQVTVLEPSISIDIPVGTAFQYRCTGAQPLQVPLPLDASLARRRGSDPHRGAVAADSAGGVTERRRSRTYPAWGCHA